MTDEQIKSAIKNMEAYLAECHDDTDTVVIADNVLKSIKINYEELIEARAEIEQLKIAAGGLEQALQNVTVEVDRLQKECDSKEKAYTEEYILRKELKSENESLKEAIISKNLTPTAYKVMQENDEKYIHIINSLKAEIEGLKSESKVFDKDMEWLSKPIKTIRAEAIKEFWERLKTTSIQGFWDITSYVAVDDGDNLVKEMVGETNG